MARFKPGQEVVCVKEGLYFSSLHKKHHSTGPKYGDIVTVDGYHPDGSDYIYLKEWPTSIGFTTTSWYEGNFKELMDITELTEILEHQTEEA